MTIKTKLLSLIFLVLFSFIIAIALFLIIKASINTIEKERQQFLKLERALLELQLEISRISRGKFSFQRKNLDNRLEKMTEAFKNIDNIKILTSRSEKISKAVASIKNMQHFIETI